MTGSLACFTLPCLAKPPRRLQCGNSSNFFFTGSFPEPLQVTDASSQCFEFIHPDTTINHITMFKRSLLSHIQQFSTRRLTAPAVATQPYTPRLVGPTVRQWQLVPRTVRRAYSAEAKEEKPSEEKPAEDKPTDDKSTDEPNAEPAADSPVTATTVDGTKLAKQMEKIQADLEAKTKEVKDLKVCSPLLPPSRHTCLHSFQGQIRPSCCRVPKSTEPYRARQEGCP